MNNETNTTWANTHCYLCGRELTAREIELMTQEGLDFDEANKELAKLDAENCGCWAAETAASRTVL